MKLLSTVRFMQPIRETRSAHLFFSSQPADWCIPSGLAGRFYRYLTVHLAGSLPMPTATIVRRRRPSPMPTAVGLLRGILKNEEGGARAGARCYERRGITGHCYARSNRRLRSAGRAEHASLALANPAVVQPQHSPAKLSRSLIKPHPHPQPQPQPQPKRLRGIRQSCEQRGAFESRIAGQCSPP